VYEKKDENERVIGGGYVPEWEEYPHTPGVFVKVRNKRDKSRQRTSMKVRPERTIAISTEH
jgi:hypothetical protein